MLINRVSDVNDKCEVNEDRADDQTQEYQTATELFNIMSKDHQLNATDALTASDLVLLYKNLDVGTNLVSESSIMTKKPNQHVETVVHNDDPDSEDSDISEIYNTDDINIYDCNKDRLDILNNEGNLGNTLCQKLGGIEIQTNKLNNKYHQHFNIFQDPFIKDQLNYNLGLENIEGVLLPATLLDYICCKRFEDNYNFYMDNIIQYVKHTIEQLKRISNGDYLTEKAKEKWREVSDPVDQTNSVKILATSTSIPLHIECKTSKLVSAWDDIVHSEVDVRSLSKILEKKIIIEVPKLICGTYKLFSRRCADNLIISCKRENNPIIEDKREGSRVDVVLQLEKSQSGHIVSNISSIMILKTQQDICVSDLLPLPYKDAEDSFFDPTENNCISKLQIVEIKNHKEDCFDSEPKIKQDIIGIKNKNINDETHRDINNGNEYPGSDSENTFSKSSSYFESSESNDAFRDGVGEEQSQSELLYEIAPPNERQLTMQRFNMASSLPEESIDDISQNVLSKKKSPIRVRIKSPYENQSHILEEKKRRRLLEIREKRERKKLALGEICKISKHKYARGGIMPQACSSVTKLSITNKSFYNSIYGQTVVVDEPKTKNRKGGNNEPIPELPLDEGDHDVLALTSDAKKYINRSYYLDDTETEMMYMQTRQNKNSEIKACSATTSVESSDFRDNLTLLSQLIGPSKTNLNAKLNQTTSEKKTLSPEINIVDVKENNKSNAIVTSQSIINLTPTNTPKNESAGDINAIKKTSSSVECRKSIDKIYDLMKKLEKGDANESDLSKTKMTSVYKDRVNIIGHRVSSTIQGSDSGTSLKHNLTSSNPSSFSFEKTNTEVTKVKTTNFYKKSDIPVVPKVIISNKVQIIKTDEEKILNPKRPINSPIFKTKDNPLKAISQLLHEFVNVKKCRQNTGDSKANKRYEVMSNDLKSNSYQGSCKRRSRLELHLKDAGVLDRIPKVISPGKLQTSLGIIKNTPQQVRIEENHNKVAKRKITDIIDEVKEAKGEAVKGPSKFNSRLYSLAQPKKSYVQARMDERPSRPAKILAERQQKVATAPIGILHDRNVGSVNSRKKAKRTSVEAVSSVSVKQPPMQPLDKAVRKRWSANTPEDTSSKPVSPVPSSKINNVPPTPEILKKMVGVEAYVKNHYRRAPPTLPIRHRPLVTGHKSRIPLFPKDIELASISSVNTAEESTVVGSKLHHMISTMLEVTPSLTVSQDFLITGKKTDNLSITEDLCRGDERSCEGLDYPLDVFGDKHIVSAIKHISKRTATDKVIKDLKILKSATEIEKLENDLCRKWPIGTFQKRLRIKNLTLTPKHSMNQIFVRQSGDSSLIIKSSLSNTIDLESNNDLQDLKVLPMLSKTELYWNFTNFPMQIATVGYAFPQYQSPFELDTKIKFRDEVYKTAEPLNDVFKSNEDIKVIVEQSKTIIEEIPEDEGNTDESCIPTLKVKAEEGKVDLVQGFVDEIKSYENTDNASLNAVYHDNEAIRDSKTQKPDSKNIDHTTSLDILMGLLDEIQKITSCQTHITNNDVDDQRCKELETVLDDASDLEALSNNPRELVSIASLDKLRKLESQTSMYTIYLSSDEENDNISNNIWNITTNACQPLYVDKEINVDIGTPECINRFTDVPSIFPLNVDHSTNLTNSLIGMLSQPSSQSVFSCIGYQPLYSNSSFDTYKKVIQLPQHVADENKEKIPKFCVAECKEKGKLNEKLESNSLKSPLPCNKIAKRVNQRFIQCKKIIKKESHASEFDPMLKIKRDILVTVYSILVITVFAALSFPEVLYHV